MVTALWLVCEVALSGIQSVSSGISTGTIIHLPWYLCEASSELSMLPFCHPSNNYELGRKQIMRKRWRIQPHLHA
jgi:hypothetical protein